MLVMIFKFCLVRVVCILQVLFLCFPMSGNLFAAFVEGLNIITSIFQLKHWINPSVILLLESFNYICCIFKPYVFLMKNPVLEF